METTTKTPSNGQTRKTLASQLDRLDGILDGLDVALSGAVSEAVEQAVKQAVQAVLTEVLTNRDLQEQLRQAASPAPKEEPHDANDWRNRLWRATTEQVRRTVSLAKRISRGVGLGLLAAGGVLVGIVYAARKRIASMARTVYRHGKQLIQGVVVTLASLLPSFAFGGI
jgi:hypothetical protein